MMYTFLTKRRDCVPYAESLNIASLKIEDIWLCMFQRKQNVQIQKNFPRNSKKSEYINENVEHFCINYWFRFQKIIWGLTSKRNSIILNPISIDMREEVGSLGTLT